MNYLDILILSLIEGLTEFLPVSSTGHLILTSHYLNLESTDFLKAFEVIIQFGAILAVLVLYKDKFFKLDSSTQFNLNNFINEKKHFYSKIIIGSLPILILGFILKDKIDQLLDSPAVVAWSLILGGFIFILTDKFFDKSNNSNEISFIDSIKIGLIQCLALIPGVSRSGATIIGAQSLKYSKDQAAEFSFFLALPTLTAATLYKTYKIKSVLNSENSLQLMLGIFLSFIFALFAIKFFIAIVKKYGFKFFGFYRIILGVIVIISLK